MVKTKLRRAWAAGARAAIDGWSFAMNPWVPLPKTGAWVIRDPRGRCWAEGYWWAKENRCS